MTRRAPRLRVVGQLLPAPRVSSARDWIRALAWAGWVAFCFVVPVLSLLVILRSIEPPANGLGDEDLTIYVDSLPDDRTTLNVDVDYRSWIWSTETYESVYVVWTTTKAFTVPDDVIIDVWGDGHNGGADWSCRSSQPPGGGDDDLYYALTSYPDRASIELDEYMFGGEGVSASIHQSVERVPVFLPPSDTPIDTSTSDGPLEGGPYEVDISGPLNELPVSNYTFSISCHRDQHDDVTNAPRVQLEVPTVTLGGPIVTRFTAHAGIQYPAEWTLDSEIVHSGDTYTHTAGVTRLSYEEDALQGSLGPDTVLHASFVVANPSAQQMAALCQQLALLVLGAWFGILGGAWSRRLTHPPGQLQSTEEASTSAGIVLWHRQPRIRPSAAGRRSRRPRPGR